MVTQKTKMYRYRILRCLAEAKAKGHEFLWIRELARRTGINMGTVNWILYRYLYPEYIEFPNVDPLLEKGLKIRPIKLKDSVFEQIVANAENSRNDK